MHQRLLAAVTCYLRRAEGSRSAAQLLQHRARRQDPMENHVLIHLDRPSTTTRVHRGVSAKCLGAAGLRRGLQREVG